MDFVWQSQLGVRFLADVLGIRVGWRKNRHVHSSECRVFEVGEFLWSPFCLLFVKRPGAAGGLGSVVGFGVMMEMLGEDFSSLGTVYCLVMVCCCC